MTPRRSLEVLFGVTRRVNQPAEWHDEMALHYANVLAKITGEPNAAAVSNTRESDKAC